MTNLDKIAKEIEKINDRKALGWEGTLYFNKGYINALFRCKKISLKEKSSLIKVYANPDNGFNEYYIEKGKLVYEQDDYYIDENSKLKSR